MTRELPAHGNKLLHLRWERFSASQTAISMSGRERVNIWDPNPTWIEHRDLETVKSLLPTFEGKDLISHVKDCRNPTVWDLGSGNEAVALTELMEENPNANGVGVTLPFAPLRGGNDHPRVQIVESDVGAFLRNFDRSKRPNIIYSSNMFIWHHDPLSVLKQAYAALAEDGILFIDNIRYARMPIIDSSGALVSLDKLQNILRNQGYSIEITPYTHPKVKRRDQATFPEGYSVAMKKTAESPKRLRLPIRILTPEILGKEHFVPKGPFKYANRSFVYQLKE